MCDCFKEKTKELEKKMPEIIEKKDNRFVKMLNFWPKDIILSFDGGFAPPFTLQFEGKYQIKQKNGKVVTKTMPVNLNPTYCPLCGEKYPKQ
jgi:hypothetical protein